MGQCCDCFKKQEQKDQALDETIVQKKVIEVDSVNEQQTETITIRTKNDGRVCLDDFKLLKTLGRGSFGKVLLVRHKETKALYALKIVPKMELKEKQQQNYAISERQILARTRHPFLVRLYYAFQSQHKLYYAIDFCQGGELFFHLRKAYKFKEDQVLFYAAEIILALEYLHGEGIIYRDIKPENILLCSDGHIKLTDFGLSKIVERDRMTYSIVGTPEYLAPEVYEAKQHDDSCDWWSLGALMYEMLTGAAPFYSKDRTLMFRNRAEKPLDIKPWFSEACASLLQGLLDNNPKSRLNVSQIRNHPFFAKIEWDEVLQKKLTPPIVPQFQGEIDLKFFNKMYVDEPAQDSPVYRKDFEERYDKFSFEEI